MNASSNCLAQNDCVDAIIICGDANLSGLETIGIGVQEISLTNACSSAENNSIWLKVKIKTGGTFGFLITPESNEIVVDFDFWVFGPNVTCGNLGTAVRCSTTNPLQAGQLDNLTGMNATETDISEGPGQDGNSFIKWMDVLDDETYYIAIDRPVGKSNFAISWTGTATFYQPPVAESVVEINGCDIETIPDGLAIFNLLPNLRLAIGNQTNLGAIFYTNFNDAVTENNPIISPENFQNTTNPQTIFIRLTNSVTGCFDITSFDLRTIIPNLPITNFSYKTPICNEGKTPIPITNTGFSEGGIYSASPNGLAINPDTGYVNLSNSEIGNYTITYTIDEINNYCYASQTSKFDLKIEDCQIQKGISPNNDSKNDFFDLEKFEVKELGIFNRYGIKVYGKLNYTNQWNGLSDKGKELPDATYYYIIDLKNGETKTGWIYINREN